MHIIFQVRILERVAIPFSRGSSDPGIEPECRALQADSLPKFCDETMKIMLCIYLFYILIS